MRTGNNPNLHFEKAMQAYARSDFPSAREAGLRALAAAPGHPFALNLLGATLLQLGEPAQALEYLERAASQERRNPGVIGNLAQAYLDLGRHEEARDAYRKASRLDPRASRFPLGMAIAYAKQGRLSDAESLLRRLADRFPQDALIHFNLGNVLRDLGRPDETIKHYQAALTCDPQLIDARNNLGGVLQALLRFEDAEHEYRRCLELSPRHPLALCNLASVLLSLGRFDEADRVCRDLIALAPDMALAHSLLGASLSHRGRLVEALSSHQTAVSLTPDDGDILTAYGMALAAVGKDGEALRCLSRALELGADVALTRQKLAAVLLASGHLPDGWAHYAHRPARLDFVKEHPGLVLANVLPDDLHGKHVLLLREQGLGDEVFFLRYTPLLAGRGARVTYVAGNKIAGLLARTGNVGAVIRAADPPPAADAVMLVGDLPHALSVSPSSAIRQALPRETIGLKDFARRIAVFHPPVPQSLRLVPQEISLLAVRERLAAAGAPPYLGITWRGGIPAREHRSAAWTLHKELDKGAFGVAVRGFRGTLLALQRNPESGEIAQLAAAADAPVHDFSDLNEDLEGMTALLAVIDEYVGVSNTNMHLRAAVGRHARVLVPCPCEWRWMHAGRASPWFPGFRIYRQGLDGGWTDALDALQRDLRNMTDAQ